VKIHAGALDTIFKAMKGLRIFERFGFNLEQKSYNTPQYLLVKDYDQWYLIQRVTIG